MAKKTQSANPSVTKMLPVADPQNGIRPSRLLNRMNRNSVHRNGTYSSASSPMDGRATSLRMNVSRTSRALSRHPTGGVPVCILRARGM